MDRVLKILLSITVFLSIFFTGCQSPQAPIAKPKKATAEKSKTQAILKLDTKGHRGLIKDVIVSRDASEIITASDDKTIRVWDAKTGLEKRKILGEIGSANEGKIFAIALSSNDRYLASAGMLSGDNISGSAIRIYNYSSGKLLKVLKSHTNVVNDLAFSEDGKLLISGSADNNAKIWDA